MAKPRARKTPPGIAALDKTIAHIHRIEKTFGYPDPMLPIRMMQQAYLLMATHEGSDITEADRALYGGLSDDLKKLIAARSRGGMASGHKREIKIGDRVSFRDAKKRGLRRTGTVVRRGAYPTMFVVSPDSPFPLEGLIEVDARSGVEDVRVIGRAR